MSGSGHFRPSARREFRDPVTAARYEAGGDGRIFGSRYGRAMAQTAGHHFLQKMLPVCNAPPASNFGHSPT
jgi:hypothetical protein